MSHPLSRSSSFVRLDYRHIRWSFFYRFPRFQFEQNSLSRAAFFFVVVSCQPVVHAMLCQGTPNCKNVVIEKMKKRKSQIGIN